MTDILPNLPGRLVAYLRPGALAVVMTSSEDGYPTSAFSWVVALDGKRVRFCADHGSSTIANLQRDGRVALQFIGSGNLVVLAKGTARQLKERIAAVPMRAIALWEMSVTGARDKSWPGAAPAPLAVEWAAEQREAMLKMQQAVYDEMRA